MSLNEKRPPGRLQFVCKYSVIFLYSALKDAKKARCRNFLIEVFPGERLAFPEYETMMLYEMC